MNFKEMTLSKEIKDAINELGYTNATPIQEQAIPSIIEGRDIIGIAQTGTGKTAAFSLPIIDRLIKKSTPDHTIKALILSPTRELAIQTRDNIRDFSKNTEFKCGVVLGGVNISSQKNVLKNGVDILVATPGRLLDLVKQHACKLGNVKILVLDEADTMLDMGFINDVRKIEKIINKERQTLLFTATMSKEIESLTNEFLINPVVVNVAPAEVTADKIAQSVYLVYKRNKVSKLLDILNEKGLTSALIFTRTKHGANKLEADLNEYGLKCSVIHGNKTQTNRVKALKDFKNGTNTIMLATDIASRGIDIPALSHVINYDLPEYPEIYVHRIGRTARAGLDGIAISLCSEEEVGHLKDVEKLIGMTIPCVEVDYKKEDAVYETKSKRSRGRGRKSSSKKDFGDNGTDYKRKSSSSSYSRSNNRDDKKRDYKKTSSKNNFEGKTDDYIHNSNAPRYAKSNNRDEKKSTGEKREYTKLDDRGTYTKTKSRYSDHSKSNSTTGSSFKNTRSNNYHSSNSRSNYKKRDTDSSEYKSLKGYKYIDKKSK